MSFNFYTYIKSFRLRGDKKTTSADKNDNINGKSSIIALDLVVENRNGNNNIKSSNLNKTLSKVVPFGDNQNNAHAATANSISDNEYENDSLKRLNNWIVNDDGVPVTKVKLEKNNSNKSLIDLNTVRSLNSNEKDEHEAIEKNLLSPGQNKEIWVNPNDRSENNKRVKDSHRKYKEGNIGGCRKESAQSLRKKAKDLRTSFPTSGDENVKLEEYSTHEHLIDESVLSLEDNHMQLYARKYEHQNAAFKAQRCHSLSRLNITDSVEDENDKKTQDDTLMNDKVTVIKHNKIKKSNRRKSFTTAGNGDSDLLNQSNSTIVNEVEVANQHDKEVISSKGQRRFLDRPTTTGGYSSNAHTGRTTSHKDTRRSRL